jgi:hypothetical protein
MPCVELGYRLAFDHWGHGYATEGSRAALAFGFATLGLPEIVAMTTVHNERSRRVMRRLGMTRDPADDFDHPDIVRGHPLRGHVLYRLTAAEWDASHAYAEATAVSHAESKPAGAQQASESNPPMSETRRIARLLKESVEGPAYYGPSVLQALDGVTVDVALLTAAGTSHSIWHLVGHLTAELRHGGQLLAGKAEPWVEGKTTWPAVAETSAEAWEMAVQELVEANRALGQAIEALEVDTLERVLVQVRSTYYAALHGYAQHNAYHAGQIALLKRQFASSRIRL